jgi:hypothetical protein
MKILVQILFLFLLPGIPLAQQLPKKINGACFYPPPQEGVTVDMIASVRACKVGWVAFIPEAVLERESLTLRSKEERTPMGKREAETTKAIALAKSIGLKVMLKPHIELGAPIPVKGLATASSYFSFGKRKPAVSEKDKTQGATWRGDFAARTEADWKTWEQYYGQYILTWARIADSLEVDLFCIGTELKMSATQRPEFWLKLIQQVRGIYKGQLTYAANWDEYDRIAFWGNLDYIGIDAYFPISESKTPEVAEVVASWKPISEKLKALSRQYDRQVLITEFGYRNVNYAGLEPWAHDNGKSKANELAQANLYEGFFRVFQQESYIAGSFLWQWLYRPLRSGNTSFSPWGKAGMGVLERWYGGG